VRPGVTVDALEGASVAARCDGAAPDAAVELEPPEEEA